MKCSQCKANAVITVIGKRFCAKHFSQMLEHKVQLTITKFKLASKDITVACSGGKDSTGILHILHKQGFKVQALAIDEGIKGYRDKTLNELKKFCSRNKIPLKVVSFKAEFGFTLDQALQNEPNPCSVCGVLRRYLLNKYATGTLATGHNLDDEAQSIVMNLFTSNSKVAARLGPRTGIISDAKFIPRIKPLYFCSEREMAAYAVINDFGIEFLECPYAGSSFRADVRDRLNELEASHPGTKLNIVNNFLKLKPKAGKAEAVSYCSKCGQPSEQQLCKACSFVAKVRNDRHRNTKGK